MLAALQMPANFVPVTNDVLKEMMRRGITRSQLLTTLQIMGGEVPTAVTQLLRWAKARGLDVKVLSDCNSVFIDSILAGAQLSGCVQEVITNQAGFASSCCTAQEDAPGLGAAASSAASSSSSSDEGGSSSEERSYLSISPRVDYHKSKHGCGLCPENLCKGRELATIQQQQLYDRIVYAGDGANDICPALQLRKGDVLLARAGHALAEYVAAAGGDASLRQVEADVHLWEDHAQLAALVQQFA
jgi:phosphoglycolate phosphatase-like HAD superfamily hydrolase